MAVPRLRDERLAWLAVRNDLDKIIRHSFMGRIRILIGGRRRSRAREQTISLRLGHAQRPTRPDRTMGDVDLPPLANKQMVKYSIAVHDVSSRMSAEERAVLRATGKVPPWFLDAVRAEAKKV